LNGRFLHQSIDTDANDLWGFSSCLQSCHSVCQYLVVPPWGRGLWGLTLLTLLKRHSARGKGDQPCTPKTESQHFVYQMQCRHVLTTDCCVTRPPMVLIRNSAHRWRSYSLQTTKTMLLLFQQPILPCTFFKLVSLRLHFAEAIAQWDETSMMGNCLKPDKEKLQSRSALTLDHKPKQYREGCCTEGPSWSFTLP
jgi:hypothetical protein